MHPFAYYRARTVEDAATALTLDARPLAGGTTLYDLMKLGIEKPARLVDINNAGLSEVYLDGETLVLGASVRMSEAMDHPLVVEMFPALSESLWRAASQQLRNMASLGGNLMQRTSCSYFRHGQPYACNKRNPGSGCSAIDGLNRGHALFGGSAHCIATYPGDFATALAAFDVELDIRGPHSQRRIALEDLHLEPGERPDIETSLASDEIITAIRVLPNAAGPASTYHKIRDRQSYAFAVVSAAVALDLDGGTVRDARISLGGVATRPWRSREAERVLIGKQVTDATAREAGVAAFAGAHTTPHNEFKRELGARVVADALITARSRT